LENLYGGQIQCTFLSWLANIRPAGKRVAQRLGIKLSHCKPGQAHRAPGGEAPRICGQSAHEGGKVAGPTQRPP
jgi:hypothetical protein